MQHNEDVKENKKLTIITINYNNRDGLRKTIESVVAQTTHDFEYIIIDGGSTDGSVDIIKEYADHIDYWISEPDKGVYNAMNKGVAVATGEYCQFLNSGDWLYDKDVTNYFLNLNEYTDIILGNTAHIRGNDIAIGRSVTGDISFFDFYKGGINHQSSYIRTLLCRRFPYDENYKICSDWKFFIEALIIHNCSFSTIDKVITYFDMNGISNTNGKLNAQERTAIIDSLDIPQRILLDYNIFDRETYKLAKLLHPYFGFRKFICRQIERLVPVYSKLVHYKHQ